MCGGVDGVDGQGIEAWMGRESRLTCPWKGIEAVSKGIEAGRELMRDRFDGFKER